MSYTQRHSHESLPPRPRSEYKEKKKLIFFLHASSFEEDFFHPSSRPGSFAMCVAEFRHFSYPTSASYIFLSLSLSHAYPQIHTHTLLSRLSHFSFYHLSPLYANPYWYFSSYRSLFFFSSYAFSQALTHTYVRIHAYLLSPLINKIVRNIFIYISIYI